MQIEFLGTGAADWDLESRKGREDYRRYASALINGDLLIDPGPHVPDYLEKKRPNGLFDRLETVLITHSHPDHFCTETIRMLCSGGRRSVYAEETLIAKARRAVPDALSEVFHVLIPGKTVRIGRYRVTPVRSNHCAGQGECSFNYLIEEDDGKALFYGLDSAWLTNEAWCAFHRKRLSAMVFDCTIGFCEKDWRAFSHSGVEMIGLMKQSLLNCGCCDGNTLFLLSHFSRTLVPEHSELEQRLAGTGLIAAYDGMTVDI